MDDPASALDQFRQQWREEVNARSKNATKKPSREPKDSSVAGFAQDKATSQIARFPAQPSTANVEEEDGDGSKEDEESGMIKQIEGLKVRDVDEDDFSITRRLTEPVSALEHYERAVEKESQGNLGDSISHYRKAYRLDSKVDQSYKNKFFPAKLKPDNLNPSNASTTVPNSAHHSSKDPSAQLLTADLIDSFASLPILGAEPVIDGDRLPPCPIKDLPYEVLREVLLATAIRDPASFTRLAMVCKRLAYHVHHEDSIWKRVALGPEFGLASQQYDFATDLNGREAIHRSLEPAVEEVSPLTNAFSPEEDWREVFHSHPRIRFTGVYISTVNYTRAGGAPASAAIWNSPVLVVTYYRYLRFFRDGTVISLLTTSEPVDVVHHLTKANVDLVRGGGKETHPLNFTASAPALAGASKEAAYVPPTAQQLMRHALRGRWRMCHLSNTRDQSVSDIATNGGAARGDLHIETEGAGPRYMYTMHLSIKSSSRSKYGVKNNKLQWQSFWSHNQLTDDWAEFQLRNDKAFLFSRVKSYGLGY